MVPPNEPLPRFSPAQDVAQDHEFEWLLCLASAFKSCQRQQPIAFEAAEKPLQLPSANALAETLSPSAWQAALTKSEKLRRSGSDPAA